MKNKRKVINLVLMLVTTLLTLIAVTYAWFISVNKTEEIIIESGTLRVTANLYLGHDANNNGEIEEDEYELIVDKINNLTNVLPGVIYHFKLEIKNDGSVPGHLSVDMINIIYSKEIIQNAFRVEYIDPTLGEENSLISKNISDFDMQMFKNYVIDEQSTFSFYFQIIGNENITTDMAGESIKLTSFLVTLDQIQTLRQLPE